MVGLRGGTARRAAAPMVVLVQRDPSPSEACYSTRDDPPYTCSFLALLTLHSILIGRCAMADDSACVFGEPVSVEGRNAWQDLMRLAFHAAGKLPPRLMRSSAAFLDGAGLRVGIDALPVSPDPFCRLLLILSVMRARLAEDESLSGQQEEVRLQQLELIRWKVRPDEWAIIYANQNPPIYTEWRTLVERVSGVVQTDLSACIGLATGLDARNLGAMMAGRDTLGWPAFFPIAYELASPDPFCELVLVIGAIAREYLPRNYRGTCELLNATIIDLLDEKAAPACKK